MHKLEDSLCQTKVRLNTISYLIKFFFIQTHSFLRLSNIVKLYFGSHILIAFILNAVKLYFECQA